jgi:hypothetical protein
MKNGKEMKEGKSYHIRIPNNGFGKPIKIHLDKIMPNVSGIDDMRLYIFRVWSIRLMMYKYYIEPYYVLAIHNNWDYKI